MKHVYLDAHQHTHAVVRGAQVHTYHRCQTHPHRAVNSFAKAICTLGVFTPSDDVTGCGGGEMQPGFVLPAGVHAARPWFAGAVQRLRHPADTTRVRKQPRLPPTSQGGRDEDVGAVLFDDGINELLRGGSPAQEADAPLKLRHQGQWVVEQVPPLDGCVPHLPTGKLPMRQHRNTTGVRL